jgi:tripartite-type tricarboxylate transporter receptor subunit TctC
MVAGPAQSRDAKPFYDGRTVTMIIGHSAGGTYDTYARLISTHIGKFLPGGPQVIVQNMPGANTIRAANFIYSVAPQDGTVLGAVASNLVFEPLLQSAGAKYDLKKINWLPAPAGSTNLLVTWHSSPIKHFADLLTHDIKLGSTTSTSPSSITASIYRDVLGAKIETVLGYQGLPDTYLAMQRGEVDGYATMPLDVAKQRYQADLASKKLLVLAQTGEVRNLELPDIPTMLELATSEDDKTLIRVGTIGATMTFAYMMGPNVPAERVKDVRDAMGLVFKDPVFLEEASRRQVMIDPVGDQEIVANVKAVYSMPDELLARFRKIVDAAYK